MATIRPIVFGLLVVFLVLFPAVTLADEPIVGEIRIWAGDITNVPDGWILCHGQALNSTTYSDLYDAVGTLYGSGSGMVFLPDLQSKVVVGRDGTIGGPFADIGQSGGEISHTLKTTEMPNHRHYDDRGVTAGSSWSNGAAYYALAPNLGTTGGALASTYTGGGGAHNNLQPYITLNYIIFTGVYQNPTPTPTDTPTATPTATSTITPTATLTNALYLPYTSAYTYTLPSSRTLTIPVYVTFGQVLISSTTLAVLAVVIFGIVTRLVVRR